MPTVAGLESFEDVRRRATRVNFDDHHLIVASLADIIKSKKTAGRPKDLAVMYVLESTLAEAANHSNDEARGAQEKE
jgi:hypothetical protein